MCSHGTSDDYNEKNKHLWKPAKIPRNNERVTDKMSSFWKWFGIQVNNVRKKTDANGEKHELYIKYNIIQNMNMISEDNLGLNLDLNLGEVTYFDARLYDATKHGLEYLDEKGLESFSDIPDDKCIEVALDCSNVAWKGMNINGQLPRSLGSSCKCQRVPIENNPLELYCIIL